MKIKRFFDCRKVIHFLVSFCSAYQLEELMERKRAWKAGCDVGYKAGLAGEEKPIPPPSSISFVSPINRGEE